MYRNIDFQYFWGYQVMNLILELTNITPTASILNTVLKSGSLLDTCNAEMIESQFFMIQIPLAKAVLRKD